MNRAATIPTTHHSTALSACSETRLAVPGMRCAGCISKIETRLPLEPGIVSARVDFGAMQVRIAHLPDLAPPDVVAAMARIGFDAHPIAPTPDAGRDEASRQHRRLLSALAVAGFAAMNVMLLSVSVWSGAAGSNRDMFHWLSALIGVPAIIWSGRPFFDSAWAALRRGTTNMDVPISIGVALATMMSLFETATHGEHAWFDGALMLIFFLLAGRVLDGAMRERARKGAAALMEASAPGAMVLDARGLGHWMEAGAITSGMTMLVAAGERLAADGTILSGESRIDAAMLTGESTPISLRAGDAVLAGMLNLDAPLTITVTAAGDDRAIAELARIMEDAGQARSRYVRIADRAARLYAPAVHLLAALTFAAWMLLDRGWHDSLLAAIAVLIITCPCALGLAVPVAQVVASGALMRRGILVKDGSALERLASADDAVFDKTGTLTLGRPAPVEPAALTGHADAPVILALAQASRHPLSRGIAAVLRAGGITPAPLDAISEVPGIGMRGVMADGTCVTLGRAKQDSGAPSVSFTREADADGGAVTLDIALADSLRPDAAEALDALRHIGLASMLLSGDKASAVAPVAHTLGIPAIAAALPEDKLALIQRRQAAGAHMLMVGDGLNDGPALAAAHVSMAPSSASDVGQQAADLVFIGDGLMAVPRAVRVARATARIVKQNFAIAIGYNALAVPLAMAGLVTPLIAAVAMSLSSLIVVGNSLRLNGAAR